MSTNYRLRCNTCKEQGGFFSRQAWGWGNADVIENTVFLMAHAECGDYYQGDPDDEIGIRILSEHDYLDDHAEERLKWIDNLQGDTIAGTAFPRASEWQAAKEGDIREWWDTEKRAGKDSIAGSYRRYLEEQAAEIKKRRDAIKALEEAHKVDCEGRVAACIAAGGHYWNTDNVEMSVGNNGYSFESKICTSCGLTDTGAMII